MLFFQKGKILSNIYTVLVNAIRLICVYNIANCCYCRKLFYFIDQMKEPLINSDEEDFEHDDDFQKKNEVIIKMKIFLNVQRALNRFYLVIYLFKIDPTARASPNCHLKVSFHSFGLHFYIFMPFFYYPSFCFSLVRSLIILMWKPFWVT